MTQYNYDISRDLIKESTSFKKTDIRKAISLIEKAINICPEDIREDKFKLSNYYQIAGDKEKAYHILFEMLTEIEQSSSITMRNMDKMQVYEKMCTLCYSDKRYSDYIYYYSLDRYNTNLAIFIQGRRADYEREVDTFDEFGSSYSTKINSCFKKIGKEAIIETFSERFSDFFKVHKLELLIILKKSNEALLSKNYDFTKPESIGERADRILNEDNDFRKLYTKYTDDYFIEFYDKTLRPFIE